MKQKKKGTPPRATGVISLLFFFSASSVVVLQFHLSLISPTPFSVFEKKKKKDAKSNPDLQWPRVDFRLKSCVFLLINSA